MGGEADVNTMFLGLVSVKAKHYGPTSWCHFVGYQGQIQRPSCSEKPRSVGLSPCAATRIKMIEAFLLSLQREMHLLLQNYREESRHPFASVRHGSEHISDSK